MAFIRLSPLFPSGSLERRNGVRLETGYTMARAIVGGLTFSRLVTLLVVPRIYVLLGDMRNWSRSVIGRANAMAKKPILKK